MKKLLSIIAVLAILFVSVIPVFASEDGISVTGSTSTQKYDGSFKISKYVVDEADVLTTEQELDLARYYAEIEAKRKCSIIAVTQESFSGSIETYTDDFYDNGNYGYGDDHAGIMLLISLGGAPGDRDYHVTTTGEKIKKLQKYASKMGEAFVEGIGENDDFYSGFMSFGKYADSALGGKIGPFGLSWPIFIIISLAVGFILATMIVSNMKSKNKSVRAASAANYYQKNGSFVLRRQNERFLYHTVTRTPIQQNNSSSGGGGGIHTGSSGTSHGGASGKF